MRVNLRKSLDMALLCQGSFEAILETHPDLDDNLQTLFAEWYDKLSCKDGEIERLITEISVMGDEGFEKEVAIAIDEPLFEEDDWDENGIWKGMD